MTPPLRFLDLPPEGPLVSILGFLDAKSLLRAAGTCKSLRQLAPWQAVEDATFSSCPSNVGRSTVDRSGRERILRFIKAQNYSARMERLAAQHDPNDFQCSGCDRFPNLNVGVYDDNGAEQNYEFFVRLSPRGLMDEALTSNTTTLAEGGAAVQDVVWEGFVPVTNVRNEEPFPLFFDMENLQNELQSQAIHDFLSQSVVPMVHERDPHYCDLLFDALNSFTITVAAMPRSLPTGECSLVVATWGYFGNSAPEVGVPERYHVLRHRNPSSHEPLGDDDDFNTVSVWIKIVHQDEAVSFCGFGIVHADE